ncbi:MAG: sugar transferase [Candidatus Omnitrophica bacterium]|nr:sugar transferase [Candidatus Omnitrophota bacterium]
MFGSARKKRFELYLIVIDTILLCAAFYLAAMIRFGFGKSFEYIRINTGPLSVTVIIFLSLFYLGGLYEVRRLSNYLKIAISVCITVVLSMLLSSFIFYADISFKVGRGVFAINSLFIIIFVTAARFLFVLTASKKVFDQNVIIVGTGEAAKDVINTLNKCPTSLYNVVGVIREDNQKISDNLVSGHRILGKINEISRIVEENKINIIILTTFEPDKKKILENLRICRYRGTEIINVISLYEELEGQIPLKYVDDEWLFASSVKYPNFHVKKLKRFMDIMGSLLGLILTLPVCFIAAMLIKFDSKGPIFYKQKRVGRFGKVFRVIKFRSMINRAEKGTGGPVWSQEKDPRITWVGRWLRRLRIDEIPQLFNILVGDMSLIGPRPERPAFVRELSEKISFYPERLYVQPGLTGWAQVNYPYTSNIEQAKIKLQYDLYYIKNVSFFLDCLILLKTLKIAFLGRGR